MLTVKLLTLAIFRVCEGFTCSVTGVAKCKVHVDGQISFICISCPKYFI